MAVRDETLLFITKDEEKSLLTVRVYPVGDLIGGSFDKDNVDEEYARLLDVITRSVDPDSWASLDKEKTGPAYISYLPQGRAMICTQRVGVTSRSPKRCPKCDKRSATSGSNRRRRPPGSQPPRRAPAAD